MPELIVLTQPDLLRLPAERCSSTTARLSDCPGTGISRPKPRKVALTGSSLEGLHGSVLRGFMILPIIVAGIALLLSSLVPALFLAITLLLVGLSPLLSVILGILLTE